MKKIVISWLLCVLALVALLAFAGHGVLPQGEELSEAQVKADFTLATADNKVVRSQDLKGSYLLVYFGFTHCPDVCPTTLLLMSNVIDELGDKATKIKPLFISVDPERDTPKIAAEYASHFNKSFIGLSGTPEQVKHAADSFKVYYSKVEDKSSALGYVVDHSGFIYLMGKNGEYLAHFPANVSDQELKQGLQHYVK